MAGKLTVLCLMVLGASAFADDQPWWEVCGKVTAIQNDEGSVSVRLINTNTIVNEFHFTGAKTKGIFSKTPHRPQLDVFVNMAATSLINEGQLLCVKYLINPAEFNSNTLSMLSVKNLFLKSAD